MIHIICAFIISVIIYFLNFKFDNSKFKQYINEYNIKLKNEKLSNLINGDALENLPNLTINTTNLELKRIQNCRNDFIYLSSVDEPTTKYTNACLDLCGSDSKIVKINKNDDYFKDGKRIAPGNYCTAVNTKCNLKTGYVASSGLGGVVCLTKYPNMFGGPTASTIVACSDEKYPANGSVLWDRLYNAQVDATTIIMNSEDETMPDGSYRFYCKFNHDQNKNKLLQHPANRFHPIADPCLKKLYSVIEDAGLKYKKDGGGGWYCDCASEKGSRLTNLDPNDEKSRCTNCSKFIEKEKNEYNINIPYDCFNINSNLISLNDMVPCNPSNFIVRGSECDIIKLKMSTVNPFGVNSTVYANLEY